MAIDFRAEEKEMFFRSGGGIGTLTPELAEAVRSELVRAERRAPYFNPITHFYFRDDLAPPEVEVAAYKGDPVCIFSVDEITPDVAKTLQRIAESEQLSEVDLGDPSLRREWSLEHKKHVFAYSVDLSFSRIYGSSPSGEEDLEYFRLLMNEAYRDLESLLSDMLARERPRVVST